MIARRSGIRLARLAAGGALGLALAVGTVSLIAWALMRASLPRLDGKVAAPELLQAASIERDQAGSVTVRALNRTDLAYATGLAHAQDRFFQMDLLRRSAAGELAALIGSAALPLDLRNRPHRFRARAHVALARLPASQLKVLQAYTAGVNAGLQGLRVRPFEYGVLRTAPVPWTPADSLLAVYAMYFDLQAGELNRVLARGVLRQTVAADLLAVLTLPGSHWDATLDGEPAPAALPTLPATRPDWLDAQEPINTALPDTLSQSSALGSNAWAVSGPRSGDGRAMVANDMHLGIRLPGIWYRLALHWPNAEGGLHRVAGVSLPGAPAIVAGSNGKVAWGFTNSYGHFIDLVRLELEGAPARRYRDEHGQWRELVSHDETIAVRGGEPVRLTVNDTHWGPVHAAGGQSYAMRWIAHLPDAADLGLLDMEAASDVAGALRVAQAAGIPTQNVMVADASGQIGWTLAGPLAGAPLDDHGFPTEAAQASRPLARLAPEQYPALTRPESGLLWSGNSTQLSDPAAQARIGDGGADVGARATQIRDALQAQTRLDEPSMLRLQLDDRALWAEPWRQVALQALDQAALSGQPQRESLRELLVQWNGRADVDGAGYTLVRDLHRAFYESWFGGLDRRIDAAIPGLALRHACARLLPLMEALVAEQAWRPARFADWRAFVLDRIDHVVALRTASGKSLHEARWGDENRLDVAHPFARLLPAALRRWFSAPAVPMAGDINMPRVQGPAFGASQRLVVAPGHEDRGLLTLPGGASGHPLSPFFLAGHDAWVNGETAPLLPGPAVHRLALVPAPHRSQSIPRVSSRLPTEWAQTSAMPSADQPPSR